MIKTYNYTNVNDANSTLNNVLDIIVEGTWDWNAKTGHVDRNPGWYRMLGYEVGTFLKDVFTWENIIHPDDHNMVMKHFELYTTGKIETYKVEYRCKKSDDSYLWIIDRGKVVEYDNEGNVARMIGVHENIHERKMAQIELLKKNQLLQEGNLTFENLLSQKNKELEQKNLELEKKIREVEYLSVTDPLTTIGNRRKFEQNLEKEVARARRYKHSLSLVMFDIDYFKQINDKHGHEMGDHILHQLSLVIKNRLRENDCFARWGGEEFVLIFPETNLEKTINISDKFRELINQIDFDNNLFITCSFGVTEYKLNESVNDLFSRVDNALYQAKELGRNRVESM